jgi:uncharacterized protein YgiM (DUF1202 family)
LKYIFVFAVILLLIGSVAARISYISETIYYREFVEMKENTESISGYFESGEKIIVEFTPGENWSKVTYPENEKYMYVYFNITDNTTKNATMFEVELFRPDKGYIPTINKITVLKFGSISADVQTDNQTAEIGGVVNCNDEYEVFIAYVIPEQAGLPLTLTLWRYIPQKHQPYDFLRIPGVSFMVLGAALIIYYGTQRRKKVRRTVGVIKNLLKW